MHLGVDEGTGEILAAVVTTNDVADCEVLPDLLEQIEHPIEQLSGDGGYDTFDCYDAFTKCAEGIAQRGATATIPPRSNALVQQHGNCKTPPHPRDENLRSIRQVGRKLLVATKRISSAFAV